MKHICMAWIYWDGTSASGVTLDRPRLTVTALG